VDLMVCRKGNILFGGLFLGRSFIIEQSSQKVYDFGK
jgi:hypothetical protein